MSTLDKIVEKTNILTAILLVDLKSKSVKHYNSELQLRNPKLYTILKVNQFNLNALANFKYLKQAKEAVTEFSGFTNCGDLKLTILYFTTNIIVIDFLEVAQQHLAVVYIVENDSDIESLIYDLEDSTKTIKNALAENKLS